MKNGDTQSRQRQPPGSLASETIRNKRPPGTDISFSISRAPIGDPLLPLPPVVLWPLRQPARLRALGVIFLSHIPSCAFITFKRDRRSRWCGCLSSSSAVLLLCPFLSSIFFCHGAPDAKKRGLFESQAGDRLSSGTSKGHNSATWNFPLREVVMVVVVGVSVFYALVYGHPHSFLLPIGGCMYTLVCFALVIHRVFCFKSLLRFQARVSINSIVRIR